MLDAMCWIETRLTTFCAWKFIFKYFFSSSAGEWFLPLQRGKNMHVIHIGESSSPWNEFLTEKWMNKKKWRVASTPQSHWTGEQDPKQLSIQFQLFCSLSLSLALNSRSRMNDRIDEQRLFYCFCGTVASRVTFLWAFRLDLKRFTGCYWCLINHRLDILALERWLHDDMLKNFRRKSQKSLIIEFVSANSWEI